MTTNALPKRILTAWWLIAFGCLKFVVLAITIWQLIANPGDSVGRYAPTLIMLLLLGAVIAGGFIVAGRWMAAALPKGHYLAVGCLLILMLVSLAVRVTIETYVALCFVALLMAQ